MFQTHFKRHWVLLALLFGLFFLIINGQTQTPARVAPLLKNARRLLDSARYDEALAQCQTAFELAAPGSADAAECLLQFGAVFLERGDPDAAAQQYQAAMDALKRIPLPAPLMEASALNGLGEAAYRQKQFEQANGFFLQSLQSRMEHLGLQHPLTADVYNNLGNCAVERGQYAEALSLHQKALDIRRKTLPAQHPDLATSYNNLGNCYLLLGDPAAALPAFEAALALRQQLFGSEHPKTGQVLGNLGNCLSALGHTAQAVIHYRHALQIRRNTLGNWHPDLIPALENLGDCCFEGGDYIEALDHFRQALFIAEHYSNAGPTAAYPTLWHKIGLCYQYERDFKQALDLHLRAENHWAATFGKQHPSFGALWNNIGNCYAEQKMWNQATGYYQRAAALQLQANGNKSSLELSLIYNNLGLCYLDENPSQALAYFQKAGQQLPVYTTPEKVECLKNQALAQAGLGRWSQALQNLDLAMQYADSLDATSSLEVMAARGALLSQRGIRLHQPELLHEALVVLDSALNLSDRLRLDLSAPASRQRWTERQYPLLQRAVESAFYLWQWTSDAALLEKAFVLAERNRSLQLLDKLRQEQALQFAAVPDSLVAQSRHWAEILNQREKRYLARKGQGGETEAQGVAEARRRLSDISRQMEALSPTYARLLHEAAPATPQAIRKQVLQDGDGALVAYFHTHSAWFAFVLTQDRLQGVRLPLDTSLETMVKTFRHSIEAYPAASGAQALAEANTYANTAYALYGKIIAPLCANGPLPKKLLIVADGILAYLPFEALLCERPEQVQQFKSHHYLLRDHECSYAFSATQLLELLQQPAIKSGKTLLAVAPSFDNPRYPLRPLQHNRPEAAAVARLLHGDLRDGHEATAQAFTQLAPRYRILHLATHGYAGSGVGELSYLAFSPPVDSGPSPFLYVRDLYLLRLKAALVVLSACETNAGEYRTGEGLISLAKGFFHAGARSVVATLWRVDDAKNAALMLHFFDYLKQGLPKDIALQRAKLSFLDTQAHAEAHPVYWAAAMAQGDMSPVTLSVFESCGWWMVAGLLLVAGGAFWWRFRRKKMAPL